MVQNQQTAFAVDMPQTGSKCFDDDGKIKRTGSVWTASAHIITAVIGSGVLSLAWATAQLGWVAGPAVMLLFSVITYFTSSLLTSCYRSGDPISGKRNYTYMDAVRSNLAMTKSVLNKKDESRTVKREPRTNELGLLISLCLIVKAIMSLVILCNLLSEA